MLPNQTELQRSRMIILKKTKYGEADLIVHGLLPTGQKISLMARGALRSKKRFSGGVLEPSHHVEVVYQSARNENQISTLNEAILLNDFPKLRTDYARIELALQMIAWVSSVGQEGDNQSTALYNLLGHGLKSLEVASHIALFRLHFLVRFLNQQGVLQQQSWMQPFLEVSISDHAKLSESLFAHPLLKDIEQQLAYFLPKG